MEILKTYYLTSSDRQHKLVLKDSVIKKYIQIKMCFNSDKQLILTFKDSTPDKIIGYFSIKYSDYIKDINSIIPDRTPVPYVDYFPSNDPKNKTE